MNNIIETDVLNRLNPHLWQFLSGKYELIPDGIDPVTLVNWRRFDVMAKYIYAKYRDRGIQTDWAKNLYREHLQSFNNFCEGDGSGKSGAEAFFRSFEKVLNNVETEGFNPSLSLLPIGKDNEIIDGSHRLAACLYYGKKVHTVRFPALTANYDQQFFKTRGLAEHWLDAMAYEYCKIKKNTYLIILWPSACGRDKEISAILESKGNIVYRKNITFSIHGLQNCMREVYEKEQWLGSEEDNFSGARTKANMCFGENPLRVIVFECTDSALLKDMKEEIRHLFHIENHSVHINDSHGETLRLGSIFLNNNSIHFLNNRQLQRCLNFSEMFAEFKEWINAQRYDCEEFCIDASSVLAVYGLRDANDLDFLYAGNKQIINPGKKINEHSSELPYYRTTADDIVYNPLKHFYYKGFKFASLDTVRKMKSNRGEKKDIADIAMINRLIRHASDSPVYIENIVRAVRSFGMSGYHKIIDKAHAVFRTMRIVVSNITETIGPYLRTIDYCTYAVYYSKGTSLIRRFKQEGAYERETHEVLLRELSKCPHPVFMDVGANIGLISLFVKSKIPAIRIHAFEAGPHQFMLFSKTIVRNNLSNSIDLHNIALSNKTGDASFAVHRDRDVSGDGFLDTGRAGPTVLRTVFTTTLDDWWQKNGCPLVNVIKLDTEGSELWILQGAKHVLARCRPTIIMEISIKNLAVYEHDEIDILRFLSENRYQLFTLDSLMASEENMKSLVQCRDTFIARPRTK